MAANELERREPLVVQVGRQYKTRFERNPPRATETSGRYRFRATRLDGQQAPKVVLSNDDRIVPGRLCTVRVDEIHGNDRHGYVAAALVSIGTIGDQSSIYIDDGVARRVEALLEMRYHILFDGPQGCGKSVLARHVADVLGCVFVYYNSAYCYDPTDFIASLQLKAGPNGGQETIWLPTDLYRGLVAAIENSARRYLIFIDELSRCREFARNGIMPALDSTRLIYDPMKNSMLQIPENVQWIAATNTGSRFTGTTPLDPAQLDRFAPVKMDYPPVSAEVGLLQQWFPAVPMGTLHSIVEVADKVRHHPTTPLPLSVRATREASSLMAHRNYAGSGTDTLRDVLRDSFCSRLEGSVAETASEAGIAWRVIQDCLGAVPGSAPARPAKRRRARSQVGF